MIASIALLFQLLAPDPELTAARSLVQSGQLAAAEQRVRSVIARNASSAEPHFLLGYVLFKQQKAVESLAEYTAGAKFAAPGALDFETIGADYVLLRDYADADRWFTKSVELNPQNVGALYYLGRTKYNENLFDEAVTAFNNCLKLESTHVRALDNLGLSYQALGQASKAEAAFRAAIAAQSSLSQQDSSPLLDLGALLAETDRSTEAVSFLSQALVIDPNSAAAHRTLGKTYLHRNEFGKARSELEQSAQLEPQNAPIHFMLAQVYRKLGLAEKAKSETEQYAALSGSHSTTGNPKSGQQSHINSQ